MLREEGSDPVLEEFTSKEETVALTSNGMFTVLRGTHLNHLPLPRIV